MNASHQNLAARINDFHQQGLTRRQVAKQLGISYAYIAHVARQAGIKFSYDRSGWAETIAASRDRARTMAALYREGYTLEQIGRQFNVTRERVRQLMTRHFGTNWQSGGAHAAAERRRKQREEANDARALKKFGCTYAQYIGLRDKRKPTRAFCQQRRNAGARGIGWELNLWQWWTIWQQSGHWAERGRGQGYVMCRIGDCGPYALGNVYIGTAAHNSSEGQSRRRKHDLPIGVTAAKSGRYRANRSISGQRVYLGTFDTPELAHAAYLMATPIVRAAA